MHGSTAGFGAGQPLAIRLPTQVAGFRTGLLLIRESRIPSATLPGVRGATGVIDRPGVVARAAAASAPGYFGNVHAAAIA